MTRLKAALDPRSVAIIGASENPNKVGGRPVHYLDKFGFKGKIFPINPSRSEVQGHKCYKSLADLPEAPDMTIVAVAGDNAIGTVEDCAAHGVKVAVVMASGFGEVDAVAGKAKERRMVEAAHKAGMRIVGPNSQGLANFGTGTIASFSTMFMEMEPSEGQGLVAMLSQSGALSSVPVGFLRQRGIGVRHTHATGNDADITVGELAVAVAEDPEVKLLLLYLESIPDTKYLEELASVALKRDLPIVALKSGRSEAGRQAAQSHTGALANEDRVVDAFFEQHGIWRAPDMRGLVEATELYLKGWKPKGRRLVAISNSGAVCVMTADAATNVGMPMAKLSAETDKKLKGILPSFATTTNPIDLTAALLSNSRLFGDILPVIAEDPAADAFLIGVPVAGPGYDVEAFARDAAAFGKQTGKPLVIAATQKSVADQFAAEGSSVFPTETEAVTALHQFLAHRELMAHIKARQAKAARAPWVPAATTTMLNEADSLALLAERGIPVVPYRLCRSRAEAIAAFETIGGPVVVKGCSADIAHKSELGLVKLGVSSREEAGEVWAQMEAIIRKHGSRFDGVIVAAMAGGRREIMIGAHRDPVFGPVVAVGDGGKYVEIFRDTALLLPPFSKEEAKAALHKLRIAPLFAGVRGEPPMDIEALCDAVMRIGDLMMDPTAKVVSLDLNPVLLDSAGKGCVVVDAVVFQG
ncbi:acetate--CoA ligase family protein [Bradyrhizobium erythrophlei]|uniref:Acyl-CoA synthetase (NDP forming) n=1 Tax=Bradyrhizobium erythrophlei TaxID=1437360 RepID=A0A1M7UXP6_9BRAD|nr:acetate--CoA ligase family protein [Bradyrhizobium erythrophlei]SHN87763.1 Acyl-CoA synthetase (NDP forming) [Bradyrhizobium erythrophlei]